VAFAKLAFLHDHNSKVLKVLAPLNYGHVKMQLTHPMKKIIRSSVKS